MSDHADTPRSAPLEVKTERERLIYPDTREVVRVLYRRAPARQWTRFLLVPDDAQTVEECEANAETAARLHAERAGVELGETGDLERDARWCAQGVLSFDAALSAVEQERDEQDVQLAETITAKVEAEREVERLKAQLAAVQRWFRDKPWMGHPDGSSHGCGSYTDDELALGYGSYRDPRFLPIALASVSGADATEEQE